MKANKRKKRLVINEIQADLISQDNNIWVMLYDQREKERDSFNFSAN